ARVSSRRVSGEDWRVEVELDDEQHGYSLRERLRSVTLDDDVRKRLGGRVIVSRDGSRLFLYAATGEQSREAERVVRELLAADDLTAEVYTTRWHPIEQAWKNAAVPFPVTSEEIAEEQSRLEESERQEAKREGSWDWHVRVELPTREAAVELAETLHAQGGPVHRRWRYVTVSAATEEAATELAARLRDELPDGSAISVNAEPPDPVFVLLGSRF
ncbi:MAG: hypothetical protein ACRDO9_13270, partial [Gaiellales bacterium]